MLSKYSDMYMRQAFEIASFSHCPDRKVGCVITEDDRVIANGYNGRVAGGPNNCLDEHGATLPDVIHAEANAINWLLDRGRNCGDTIYVTLAPCLACANLIVSANIKNVVYCYEWPKSSLGLEHLEQNNINIFKWEGTNV